MQPESCRQILGPSNRYSITNGLNVNRSRPVGLGRNGLLLGSERPWPAGRPSISAAGTSSTESINQPAHLLPFLVGERQPELGGLELLVRLVEQRQGRSDKTGSAASAIDSKSKPPLAGWHGGSTVR